MADLSIYGVISGDASEFISAVDQAKESLNELGNIAGGVFAGIELSRFFDSAIEGLKGFGENLLEIGGEFQQFNARFDSVADNVASNIDAEAMAAAGGGGKLKSLNAEIEDAMITHKEKVQKIQDDIAEVMAGKNVLDAREQLNTRLSDLLESHLQKVRDIEDQIANVGEDLELKKVDRQQSMQNKLADMTTQHEMSLAEKKERYDTDMANSMTDLERALLTAKYEDQLKIDTDAFQRKYDNQKAIEERNIAQAEARDKAAADKRVSKLEEQLSRENEQYSKQSDRIKAEGDKQIAQYEVDNAKKLALYKQELEDEERSYKMHMDKMKESAAGGGGGGAAKPMEFKEEDDPMKWRVQTAQEFLSWIEKIQAQGQIFTSAEIGEASLHLKTLGLNAQELIPAFMNVAAANGRSMNDVATAVERASIYGTRGLKVLQNEFGITKENLISAGAVYDETGKNFEKGSFLRAIQEISKTKFGNAIEEQSNTLRGAQGKISVAFEDISKAILGISEGKVKEGGLLDVITKMMIELGDYITEHKDEIAKFFETFIKNVADLVKNAIPLIKSIGDWIAHNQDLIKIGLIAVAIFGVFVVVAGFLAAAIALISGPVVAVAAVIAVLVAWFIVSKDTLWAVIKTILEAAVPGLGFLMKAIDSLGINWGKVWDGIKTAFETAFNWISDKIQKLIGWLDDLGTKAKNALEKLNPFHKESPSLVDNVDEGVERIRRAYASVGNIQIAGPSINARGMSGYANSSSQYNYNTSSYAPNLQQSNTFNVQQQGTANNIAEYLGWQLEHFGIV